MTYQNFRLDLDIAADDGRRCRVLDLHNEREMAGLVRSVRR
jgi:hypothetical protein